MITEQMIEERAKKNQREYMRAYRQSHRNQINEYQRNWYKEYKERTGKPYSRALAERRAERQLRTELGE